MLVSVNQELFVVDILELIEVYSYPLIWSLLGPKVSVKKIHYCGKILGETDIIDLVSCTC